MTVSVKNDPQKYIVFRQDYEDGRTTYSVCVSQKNINGEYENAYMPVKFRKGVELENSTPIYINDRALKFSIEKININGYERKITHWYWFIFDFETVQDKIDKYHVDFDKIDEKKQDKVYTTEMINEDDLPF